MTSKKQSIYMKVLQTLVARLQAASAGEVTSLFRGGSIWIYRSHFKNESISPNSILFLGPKDDGLTREIAENMILLVEYSGLAENEVVDTEIDDDATEDEIREQYGEFIIVPLEEVRLNLIEIAKSDCYINLDNASGI